MKKNMTKLEIEHCERRIRKAMIDLHEIAVSDSMNLELFPGFRSDAKRLESELEGFLDCLSLVYFDRYGKEL